MTYVPLDPSTIRQAQQGDPGARDQILEGVYARLLPYCLRLTRGDAEEAEEIAQETGLRLFRSFADLRELDQLMSWVFRVATNLWRDRLRGRQDYPLTRDIEDPENRDVPERRELLLEVSKRLDSLPALYRVALTLRFLNGLDYETISRIQGVPQATIRMQIARGIRLMRDGMDAQVNP